MSRHRAVRNIDLDEELAEDSFGEDNDNPYDDISEEDHIQLEDSLVQLISLIGTPGDESGFTEREMKDALWNAYFDVDQALNALVEERSKRQSREKKKADGMEEDPTLSALQRLSLKRKGVNSVRSDGNQNVAKGIRGLHFGGRAGLAKKNLASLAPEGLPGTADRKDSWNGFENLDIDLLQQSAKGNKRPADVQTQESGKSSGSLSSRPSKLAALSAARSESSTTSEVKRTEGKPLSKLQQKMQANLLARQQKKHTAISKDEEVQLRQKEEEEERERLLHLPSGDPIAFLFPTAATSSKQSNDRDAEESCFGVLLRANGKDDLAVPGGSPFQGANYLEAFSRPSPDDIVLKAREGTHLAKT